MLRWITRHERALVRFFAGFLGALLILRGIGALWLGEAGWKNYWGGLVFPPVAAGLGIVLLVGAIKGSSPFTRVPLDKKGNPIRFPHEEIRKW